MQTVSQWWDFHAVLSTLFTPLHEIYESKLLSYMVFLMIMHRIMLLQSLMVLLAGVSVIVSWSGEAQMWYHFWPLGPYKSRPLSTISSSLPKGPDMLFPLLSVSIHALQFKLTLNFPKSLLGMIFPPLICRFYC